MSIWAFRKKIPRQAEIIVGLQCNVTGRGLGRAKHYVADMHIVGRIDGLVDPSREK